MQIKGKRLINGNSRAEEIYLQLRERICLLNYKPGTILREVDLAGEFKVSRTPIRQALQRLQIEELVETKKAVGSIVTGYSFEALKDAYEVRIQILEAVANTAHRSYSQSDIADMEKLHASAQNLKRYRDLQEYWRINNQINEILGRIIDNTVLKNIHNSLYYQTARSWFQHVERMWDENIDMLGSEIKEEIKPMKIGDIRGTLMARRNYILLFLSIMDRNRSLQETPGGAVS